MVTSILILLAAISRPAAPPTLIWNDFFASVSPTGVSYSDVAKKLEKHRVRVRGYAVVTPPLEGGILLTRFPYNDPHEVEETDIPFDAVAVLWRKGIDVPSVPTRPSVEGVLRLGNRDVGPVIVSITLEDATPVYPKR